MSEIQRFAFKEKGEVYEIIIDEAATSQEDSPFGEERGLGSDAMNRMQQARSLIRNYAMYAVTAFKDFGAAEVEEVTLKFSIKMGGKTGIPYITEGSAESNLEIEVKCKFPKSGASEKS
jgi:Trypsin-co-occurring domain 1